MILPLSDYSKPLLVITGTPCVVRHDFIHVRSLRQKQYFKGLFIIGFTLQAELVSSTHVTQVHLKISSGTLKNLASHLMTKYITWSIFAVKSVIHIRNTIARQSNREEIHIVALLLKSNTAIAAKKKEFGCKEMTWLKLETAASLQKRNSTLLLVIKQGTRLLQIYIYIYFFSAL